MLSMLIRQNVSTWLPQVLRPLPPFTLVRKVEFRRKVKVDFTARDYRVKTIETAEELKQVLRLRRSVFHYEFAKKWLSLKSDRDQFDDIADHLAIFDEKKGCIAGVYRLIPSNLGTLAVRERGFYSNSEFDITRFLALPGNKLELSRACINREYRNGVVISLLWKGIAEYAKEADTDFLFGLSSMSTIDERQIARVSRYFQEKGLEDLSFGITPRCKYRIDGYDDTLASVLREPSVDDVAQQVPPLVKTYIRAGARVCSQPVIDRDFNCADWLTVLDMKRLTGAYDRKYMRE